MILLSDSNRNSDESILLFGKSILLFLECCCCVFFLVLLDSIFFVECFFNYWVISLDTPGKNASWTASIWSIVCWEEHIHSFTDNARMYNVLMRHYETCSSTTILILLLQGVSINSFFSVHFLFFLSQIFPFINIISLAFKTWIFCHLQSCSRVSNFFFFFFRCCE